MARIKGDTTLSAFAGQRPVGSTGQAAVLDGSQIKMAGITNHAQRDQPLVVCRIGWGPRQRLVSVMAIGVDMVYKDAWVFYATSYTSAP